MVFVQNYCSVINVTDNIGVLKSVHVKVIFMKKCRLSDNVNEKILKTKQSDKVQPTSTLPLVVKYPLKSFNFDENKKEIWNVVVIPM